MILPSDKDMKCSKARGFMVLGQDLTTGNPTRQELPLEAKKLTAIEELEISWKK